MQFFPKTSNKSDINNIYDLTYLANLYETDKGDLDEKLTSWHSKYPNHKTFGYTHTYEKYMNPKKNSDIYFLEIGINDLRFPYASTKMWTDYFKNINLYSMDNFWGTELPIKDIKMINNIGCNFIYADQGSDLDWSEIKTILKEQNIYFDFIVEDGSHQPDHMMITLFNSCDLLKSGGYYFMEDIQSLSLPQYFFDNYDHTILTQEILDTFKNLKLDTKYLTQEQINKINETYIFTELVLDKNNYNYLAVFQKK